MKITRLLVTVALATLINGVSLAQPKGSPVFEPVATLPVKGTLNIAYNTRTDKKAGASDVYTLNLNVANSAVFRGSIIHLPYVSKTIGEQMGRVTFDVELDVVNPANPSQTRNVGKMFGFAPVDKMNVYRYADGGGIKVAVFPIGAARGFESRYNGLAYGKPPASSGFAKLKQDAVRLVSSKGGSIVLTKYDKMTFENHVLPAGPVQIYPETTVNGIIFYDYGRSAWHFNNVTFVYNADGKRAIDTLTGSIRWIEAKNRRATGDGRYEFDIRVNEPPPTEAAAFAPTADESSFFAVEENVPSLTGAMIYKDTFTGADTVTSSIIQIDLKATKLSKHQAMMLTKLLLISAIVPINAE